MTSTDDKNFYHNSDFPLNVDIGSGKGRFIFGRSKNYPNENFLGIAKIYYSVIDNSLSKNDLNIELNKKSKFLKGIIGKKITSKKIPEISFHFDDSIEFYDKMDKIFYKINDK